MSDFFTDVRTVLVQWTTIRLTDIRELGSGLIVGMYHDDVGPLNPVALFNRNWRFKSDSVENSVSLREAATQYLADGKIQYLSFDEILVGHEYEAKTADEMERAVREMIEPASDTNFYPLPINLEPIEIAA